MGQGIYGKKRILVPNIASVYFLYNLAVHVSSFFIKLLAFFKPKIRLFVEGRKNIFKQLEDLFSEKDEVVWLHAASLGEFEQGLPVLKEIKSQYPKYKLLVTFFSPSGFEVKKDTSHADIVCYLPLDTKKNARRFVGLVQPKMALFVKYEIWPNFFRELHKNRIPIFLVSAIFKKDQVFFKSYGGFMRRALQKVTHFFVQDHRSVGLLNEIGIHRVTLSGDTRFDRVTEIFEQNIQLDFMSFFTQDNPCLVAGSTWPEDENILVPYINATPLKTKFVIAPHLIDGDAIDTLRKSIKKRVMLYSNINQTDITTCEVLIIDTIGLLAKIYSYADLAYVGGGFATGLHNTLEPAVFGIPVMIGPEFKGFKEAEDLVEQGGILVVRNKDDLKKVADDLLKEGKKRSTAGIINSDYILKNKGASVQIMSHIRTLL